MIDTPFTRPRIGPPRVTETDPAHDALIGPPAPRACCLGGGGATSAGSQTSTTTSEPWSVQIPYLTKGFDQANSLFDSGGPQYYPGSTVAPFNGTQNAALAGITQQASAGSPVTPAATNFTTNLLNGGFLNSNPGAALQLPFATGAMADPSKSPYFQSALSATLGQVLPGITNQFVQGGNLNNPAMAFAAGQGAMSAAAPLLFNTYQQGLQQQQQAAQNIGGFYQQSLGDMLQGLGAAPSVQQMPYFDLNQLWNAGTAEQQQQQAQTNADIARWNYGQQLPYSQLQQYMGTIGGTGYGGTSQTTTPYYQNAFGNAAGLGLGGALLGGAVGGPFGAAAGSLLGGLLG